MVKKILAATVFFLATIGFISNLVSEVYFGEFDDICFVVILVAYIGTWLYVKIEQAIQKRQN